MNETEHAHRPSCYTEGEATPRASWAIDEGRACMQAKSAADWARFVRLSPGCVGCQRALRAARLYWTATERHQWGMDDGTGE